MAAFQRTTLAVARLARSLGWGENPLRRRSDWIEIAIASTLLTVFAISIPMAIGIGQSMYAADMRHARQAARHESTAVAVLTDGAPPYPTIYYGGSTSGRPLVRAWWRTADGTVRVGTIRASYGAPAGSQIPIWLDESGNPTRPPDVAGSAVADAALVGVGVFLGAACGLELIRRLSRRLLDRGRLRAWGSEWEQVGPQWTRPGV